MQKARSDWLAANSRTNAMSSFIINLYMDAESKREQRIFLINQTILMASIQFELRK